MTLVEKLKSIIKEEGNGNLNFLTDICCCPEEWDLETVDEGHCWFVIYSKELDEYVKCTGRYNYADEGLDYSDATIKTVRPIQKLITVYE